MASLVLISILVFTYAPKTQAISSLSYPIGGLFNRYSFFDSKMTFENMLKIKTAFYGNVMFPEVIDSYSTALDVCRYTSDGHGISALIDGRPSISAECDAMCLLCNRLNISHLYLGWQTPDTLTENVFTFAYHPPTDLTSKAFSKLIKDLQWDKFTILYEDDGCFDRLYDVINTWPYDRGALVYRKLNPDGDNREIFKYIFKVAQMSYHIIDCNINNTKKYMEQIVDVERSTQYHSFILSNLDSYLINLRDVPELKANVSTLHVTIADDVRWRDLGMDSEKRINIETALTADALNHLEKAIRLMVDEHDFDGFDKDGDLESTKNIYPPALCMEDTRETYDENAWPWGEKMRKALLKTTTQGFTGGIQFDEYGKRTNLTMYYSKMNNESQFVYTGSWNSITDIFITDDSAPDSFLARKSNSVLRVASIIGAPYFMTKELNGTTQYIGYAVDLIKAVVGQINKANKTDYRCEFYKASGNAYGNPIPGGRKWDGLIGEIMEHKADIGVCDLTITKERNAVVDFSIPFMSLGISMLYREPEPEVPNKWSFMQPLQLDVWLYLATTYIVVSFVLLICARMSQDDWVNPHPCNQNPDSLQNIWTLYNCMWFTMGSIMTQGCDILPRAAASRWVAGVWWFFALIVTASYTANLSTFLSNNRRSSDISDVKSLAEQNKISYGAVNNASTYKFFEKSNDSVYSKIWSVMKSAKPTVFTNNNDEGKERVLKSKGTYWFFMESTAIEYYTQRNCLLKMHSMKLDSKDYGIAMPKKSYLKGLVDHALLKLQESGELENLKKLWWEHEKCEDSTNSEDDVGSLQMKNTSGIFMVLGIGGILGFVVAIIDFMIQANEIAVNEKITFREAFLSEWRASFNPKMLHKPAAPPRSPLPSTRTPTPTRERSQSRAVSVLRAASSFINFDEIY